MYRILCRAIKSSIVDLSLSAIGQCKVFLTAISTYTKPVEIFEINTPEEFTKKVIESDKPVLVDFFAKWCKPCKHLTEHIEHIVYDKAGDIKLALVDIEMLTDLALSYNIRKVPSVLMIKNGKVVSELVGYKEVEELREWINQGVNAIADDSLTSEKDDNGNSSINNTM